jgi:hypothetical protein
MGHTRSNALRLGYLIGDISEHLSPFGYVVFWVISTPLTTSSLAKSSPAMTRVSIYIIWGHADGLTLQWIVQKSLNKLLSEGAVSALTTRSLPSPTNKGIHSRNVD